MPSYIKVGRFENFVGKDGIRLLLLLYMLLEYFHLRSQITTSDRTIKTVGSTLALLFNIHHVYYICFERACISTDISKKMNKLEIKTINI